MCCVYIGISSSFSEIGGFSIVNLARIHTFTTLISLLCSVSVFLVQRQSKRFYQNSLENKTKENKYKKKKKNKMFWNHHSYSGKRTLSCIWSMWTNVIYILFLLWSVRSDPFLLRWFNRFLPCLCKQTWGSDVCIWMSCAKATKNLFPNQS